jgi:hypothetical protein
MVDAPGRPATARPRDQPARSGAWPQQVRIEMTRIRHQTRIARARSTSGFVPCLSDLDSQRQILAYALVFGYAQQLGTQLDKRAEILLAQVPSKHAKNPPTQSIPQPASAVPVADATTNGHSPAYATDG